LGGEEETSGYKARDIIIITIGRQKTENRKLHGNKTVSEKFFIKTLY